MKKSFKMPLHHSLIEYENGVVRKLIEPDFPFQNGERESLLLDIWTFRTKLRELGIPVASRYGLKLHDGKLWEETTNCGTDGYSLLLQNHEDKSTIDMVLRKIVRAFLPVLLQEEICVVPDPHPANWCFDAKANVRYIDFQPPKFAKVNGIKLIDFPQPTGQQYLWLLSRYYTRFGLLRILRFSAVRAAGPQAEKILDGIIRSECPDVIYKEFSQGIEGLLENRVKNYSIPLEVALAECDEWRVDDIRELAVLVSSQSGTSNADFLTNILEHTRVDPNLTIEERRERVQIAKHLILACCG